MFTHIDPFLFFKAVIVDEKFRTDAKEDKLTSRSMLQPSQFMRRRAHKVCYIIFGNKRRTHSVDSPCGRW